MTTPLQSRNGLSTTSDPAVGCDDLFEDVWRTVNQALKSALNAHGNITKENYGSAGKRVAALLAACYKMKPLYKHEHEGLWFSRNGHRAYMLGEKPKSLWPTGTPIEPTVAHHIEIRDGRFQCRRKLVMFYRRVAESSNDKLTYGSPTTTHERK